MNFSNAVSRDFAYLAMIALNCIFRINEMSDFSGARTNADNLVGQYGLIFL